jgi:hypothetical protein
MIMPVSQIVAVALCLVGVATAIALLITGVRGRPRVTAIVGSVLMLLGTLTTLTYRSVLDPLVEQVSDSMLILILAMQMVGGSVVIGAGAVLLTCALIVAGRPPKV